MKVIITILVFLVLFSLPVFSSERTGPDSYLDWKVNGVSQLLQQIQTPHIMARYVKHYGVSPQAIYQYFSMLKVGKIPETSVMTVYGYCGYPYPTRQRLGAGYWFFVTPDGTPVLKGGPGSIGGCGNPVGTYLPPIAIAPPPVYRPPVVDVPVPKLPDGPTFQQLTDAGSTKSVASFKINNPTAAPPINIIGDTNISGVSGAYQTMQQSMQQWQGQGQWQGQSNTFNPYLNNTVNNTFNPVNTNNNINQNMNTNNVLVPINVVSP